MKRWILGTGQGVPGLKAQMLRQGIETDQIRVIDAGADAEGPRAARFAGSAATAVRASGGEGLELEHGGFLTTPAC
jgi:hypothetical protein